MPALLRCPMAPSGDGAKPHNSWPVCVLLVYLPKCHCQPVGDSYCSPVKSLLVICTLSAHTISRSSKTASPSPSMGVSEGYRLVGQRNCQIFTPELRMKSVNLLQRSSLTPNGKPFTQFSTTQCGKSEGSASLLSRCPVCFS